MKLFQALTPVLSLYQLIAAQFFPQIQHLTRVFIDLPRELSQFPFNLPNLPFSP